MFKTWLLLLLFLSHMASAGLAPVESFGALPKESNISLSPGGKRIVSVFAHEGDQYVIIRDVGVEGNQRTIYKTDNRTARIKWVEWANDG